MTAAPAVSLSVRSVDGTEVAVDRPGRGPALIVVNGAFTHIYAKLGVANRTELATRASTHHDGHRPGLGEGPRRSSCCPLADGVRGPVNLTP